MRTGHNEYLNCNYKDAAFMWVSLAHITDLNGHVGANEKYQSRLHLEAGERQYCFILAAVVIGVRVGEEKGGGEKKTPKDPSKKKKLKAQAAE